MPQEAAILAAQAEAVRPPGEATTAAAEPWRQALREAIRCPVELARQLRLPAGWCREHVDSDSPFPLLVPQSYLQRMTPGDVADPLLRQVLPLRTERQTVDGFVHDAVGDEPATTQPGLLQKYAGRALVIATGACAVHCRYCFRRHFPYGESSLSSATQNAIVQQIAADESLSEVILSGGDPLSLSDDRLDRFISALVAIPHIRRLRIHTRWPIVLPQRVTDRLAQLLSSSTVAAVVVVHANHAAELERDVPPAIGRLKASGAMLLNQAVLLRGVNDSAEALGQLSERLVELGVVPYYLHQLDRVAGAAHFEVPIERGKQLVQELRKTMPGYMVPRYVQEIAGEEHKVPIE